MRARRIILTCLLLVTVWAATASAGTYYKHDDPGYWWYVEESPNYETVVPSTFKSYSEELLFGDRAVTMTSGPSDPVFILGSTVSSGVTLEELKTMALSRFAHVITDKSVVSDKQFTANTGITGHIYAVTFKNPSGRSAMMRLVVYQRGKDTVYMILYCYQSDYDSSGLMKTQWLTMVNSFKWLS